MSFNIFIKSSLVILCFALTFSCKENKTETNPEVDKTVIEDVKITPQDIETIKYTEYALSDLSQKSVENWLKFTELQSQINVLKNGDLSFFNDENELLSTFLKELIEQIPEDLKVPSIQARLTAFETSAYKLEGIHNLRIQDKTVILDYIKEVLVAHSNLILQINKKHELESQNIEKPQ